MSVADLLEHLHAGDIIVRTAAAAAGSRLPVFMERMEDAEGHSVEPNDLLLSLIAVRKDGWNK
jgi:hypothetical protein